MKKEIWPWNLSQVCSWIKNSFEASIDMKIQCISNRQTQTGLPISVLANCACWFTNKFVFRMSKTHQPRKSWDDKLAEEESRWENVRYESCVQTDSTCFEFPIKKSGKNLKRFHLSKKPTLVNYRLIFGQKGFQTKEIISHRTVSIAWFSERIH